LRRYRDEVIRKRKAAQTIEAQLATLEAELRNQEANFTPAICAHTVETMEERIGAD